MAEVKRYALSLSKKRMQEIGFRYDRKFDDYIYSFPVYFHNKIPTIFCKLGIKEYDNEVFFNIYSNDNIYAPYYNRGYDYNNVVATIDINIEKELKRLGAVEIE